MSVLTTAASWLMPLVIAITMHEAAHGWMAKRFGDDTAYRLGRVSFNPLRHIDPVGTLLMPAVLLLFGAPFLFGYARPVPVNFFLLQPRRKAAICVAMAGPGINFILAVLSALLLHFVSGNGLLAANLVNSVAINVVLMWFNLLPMPPLDGSRVVAEFLPAKIKPAYMALERYGIWIIMTLFLLLPMFGPRFGIHFNPADWLIVTPVSHITDIVFTLTGN